LILPVAKAGNPVAQSIIATFYSQGLGVKVNQALVRELIKISPNKNFDE